MTRGGPNIAGTNGPGVPLIAGGHKFRDRSKFSQLHAIVRALALGNWSVVTPTIT